MKILKLFSLLSLVFLLTQCYPDGPTYIEESDIVYSNYDPEYDFSAKKTFAIPAQIVKIDDALIAGGAPSYVNPTLAGPIISAIQKNMVTAGWTQVEMNSNPDVVVIPTSLETTIIVAEYWGYWGYWYGGYPTFSSYTAGTLLVSLVDSNEKDAEGKRRIGWGFLVNGLIEGSNASITNRYTSSVDQAFEQSPYLKK